MNVEAIRAFCLAFPNGAEKLQWGDDPVLQSRRQDFRDAGARSSEAVLRMHARHILRIDRAGRYSARAVCGRYKWVMLYRLDAVGDAELQELIRQSFEMVAAKTSKKKAGRKRTLAKKFTASRKPSTAIARAKRPRTKHG
jgi:predicted DNA-binding protein (MmcQ/YjbR family)